MILDEIGKTAPEQLSYRRGSLYLSKATSSLKHSRGALTLPAAIIIAGALIAITLIYLNRPAGGSLNSTASTKDGRVTIPAITGMLPVSADDHIYGNPNAPIKFVEYSDPSCPYCKLFNPTMERIMNVYGPGGKVAWVYRQFPIYKPDSTGAILHPNAGVQAEAFECAAALGGNSSFFSYLNKWYSVFPTEGATDRPAKEDKKQLADVARDVGLNAVSFNDCLSSHRFADKVSKLYDDGLASGAEGTPYTFILTPSGNSIPLSGLQDYNTLKSTIDTLLTTVDDGGNGSTNIQN